MSVLLICLVFPSHDPQLQEAGHYASHVMGAPDDHGVWIEVWNNDLGACHEFRIHDEEIEWWQTQDK